MKKITLVIVCVFFITKSYCQTSTVSMNYKLNKVLNFNKAKINSSQVEDNAKFFVNENVLAVLFQNKKGLEISFFNLDNYEEIKMNFDKKKIKKIKVENVGNFIFNKSVIVINEIEGKTHILSFNDENRYQMIKKNRINHSLLVGKSLFLFRYYVYGYKNTNNSIIYKYRLNGQFVDSLDLKSKYLEYTFFAPQKVFASNNEYIFQGTFGDYNILKIDTNLKIIDTIKINHPNWVLPLKTFNDDFALNNDENFKYISNENMNRISKIEHLDIMNDSILVVRWLFKDSNCKYNLRKLDKININNNQLVSSLLETEEYLKIGDIKMKEAGFPLTSSNYPCIYYKNMILHLKFDFEGFIPNPENTHREYRTINTKSQKNKEPIITVWIFKEK